MQECTDKLPSEAVRGITLHNAGKYFLAHEALENAWRAESSPCRLLYQGMLQISVTCYHLQRGNINGAHKVLVRSLQTLESVPETCQGVDVADLRRQILALQKRLAINEILLTGFPIIRMKSIGGEDE